MSNTIERVKRRARGAARGLLATVVAVSLSFALVPVCGVQEAAEAAVTGNDWHYVAKKKKVKCPEGIEEEVESADDTAMNQSAPQDNGDWTNPDSDAYKTAKAIFDMLTDEYGFSGAAAAGVLGAIQGEANFDIRKGEYTNAGYNTGVFFEKNSKLPHPNQCYYVYGSGEHHVPDYANSHSWDEVDPHTGFGKPGSSVYMIGGGGLFAFTPYVRFTESRFWGMYDKGEDGWDGRNQVAFALSESVATGSINGIPSEEFMSLTDPATAEYHWYTGYERGRYAAPEREDTARVANSVFNKANVKPDKEKQKKVYALAGGETTGATLDATSDADSPEEDDLDDDGCEKKDEEDGTVDAKLFVKAALEMCRKKGIGYSQQNRRLDTDVDCSSFTWYCITRSGIESLAEGGAMGSSPMTTHTAEATLTGAGFVKHPYNGPDDFGSMPPGSPIVYSEHAALFIGRYDEAWVKSHPSATYDELMAHADDNGTPLLAEASSGTGGPGDDLQDKEGVWYGNHEVSVHPVYDPGWTEYYTPDNVEEMAGDGGYGQDYASASEKQKAIVRASYSVGSPGSGLCAKWVSQVYAAAGCAYPYGNACDMWREYCKSNDRSDLKVGMMIAVEHSPWGAEGWTYGHIGIYIGDGKVRDNVGYIQEQSLDSWIAGAGALVGEQNVKWGFGPGF